MITDNEILQSLRILGCSQTENTYIYSYESLHHSNSIDKCKRLNQVYMYSYLIKLYINNFSSTPTIPGILLGITFGPIYSAEGCSGETE